MRHIGQQTLPQIRHQWHIFTIENARNFHRKSENDALKDYVTISIDISKLKTCKIYESDFWYKRLFAHCMLWFVYLDIHGEEHEIIFSIEARRPQWQEYVLWKWIVPGMYSIIYVRWNPSDLLALRKHVRHDPLVSHELVLSNKEIQDLFKYFAHKTNKIHNRQIPYHAIRYNCITDLHRWLAHCSKKLFSLTIRTIFPKWYISYLQRNWLIKK